MCLRADASMNEHGSMSSESETSEEESEIESDFDDGGVVITSAPHPLVLKARAALNQNQFDSSFSWYCTAFHLDPSLVYLDPKLELEFSTVVNCFTKLLLDEERNDDAFECLHKALSVYPENARINLEIGKLILERTSDPDAAFPYIWTAQKGEILHFNDTDMLNDDDDEAVLEANALLRHMFVDQWHFKILNDKRRNLTYKLAIQEVFKKLSRAEGHFSNGVAFDLGCGTGILTSFCLDAGFKSVIACEKSPVMCAVAKEILNKYNSSDVQISVVCERVENVDVTSLCAPKLQPDLLVTEIFDCAFFGEGVIPILSSIAKQTTNTVVVPSKANVFAIAVESSALHCLTQTTLRQLGSFKVPFVSMGQKNSATYESVMLQSDTSKFKVLSQPVLLYEIDFGKMGELKYVETLPEMVTGSFVIVESGRFDAIVVYFELVLSDTFTLTTNPLDKHCCKCWGQSVFGAGQFEQKLFIGERLDFYYQVMKSTDLSVRAIDSSSSRIDQDDDAAVAGGDLDHIIWTDESTSIVSINNFTPSIRSSFDAFFTNDYSIILQQFTASSTTAATQSQSAALIVLGNTHLLPFYLLTKNVFCKIYVSFIPALSKSRKELCERYIKTFIKDNSDYADSIEIVKALDYSFKLKSQESLRFIYIDIVDTTGILHKGSLQHYFTVRTLFNNANFIFPTKLSVYCTLVESEDLKSDNEFLSDNNVCGNMELRDKMAMFSKSTFDDVDLDFLHYKVLSTESKLVETFNLSASPLLPHLEFSYHLDDTACIQYKEAACALILIYSFGLELSPNVEIRTGDCDNLYRVAGVFLPPDSVKAENVSNLKFKLNSDSFSFFDIVS